MSWDNELAALAKPVQAPAQGPDTPEIVWVRKNAQKNDFTRSLLSYIERNGTLTPAQAHAVRGMMERDAQASEFHKAHAAEIAWIHKNAPSNSFAASLKEGLVRFGSLTERQVAAVRRNLEVQTQASNVEMPGLDLSSLPDGRYAVPDGDTRLKIRISRRDGRIIVADAAHYGRGKYYGAQPKYPGLYRGKIQEQLQEILKDPVAAIAAYGHLTGTCGICGRPLEDAESVARGIGPVCAGRL